MIFRGIAIGAVLGLLFEAWSGGMGGIGFILGGLLGWGAGAWLRSAVRAEIAAALREFEPAVESRTVSEQRLAAAPAPDVEAARAAIREQALAQAREPSRPAQGEGVSQDERAPATPSPSAPAKDTPREPSQVELWAEAARAWLLGGNTIVRIGLVILFIGLSFLASYAASIGLFPLEMRLALVALTGVALIVIGLRKRIGRPAFARALEGTGVAVLYLTVFASSRLFELIPILPAFGLLILFCALGCALALLEDSRTMALSSFAGGFAVPVLLGGSSETPLPLFAYYTMLNVAILFIAWRRSWRSLNLLGFFATFAMAALWGATSYEAQHFALAQGFLAATVAIYLATAMLYAHNTPGRLGNVADSTLLFGTAIAGFSLQAALVSRYEFGSAFAALAFGFAYVACAAWTLRRRDPGMRVLGESMVAIGVGFVTLAIPLALDVRWTSAAWALEGAGAFWVGMRQARWMPRLFGMLLIALAALIFTVNLGPNISAIPLANPGFMGAAIIALPLLLVAWWLREPLPHSGSKLATGYGQAERGLMEPVFLAGFLFAALALVLEFARRLPPQTAGDWAEPVFGFGVQQLLVLVALLALMGGSTLLGRRRDWPVATWPGRLSLPLAAIVFLVLTAGGRHVLYGPDWALWLAAIALHLHITWLHDTAPSERDSKPSRTRNTIVHAGTAWLFTAMLADCLYLGVERGQLWNTSWAGVVFLASAALVLLVLTVWAGRAASPATSQSLRWPLRQSAAAYYWVAALPLAVLVWLGGLVTALLAEGVTDPLPYIPLLNPVDLSLGLALAVLALWSRLVAGAGQTLAWRELVTGKSGLAAFSLLAFAGVNGIWLRTAHHWLAVPWSSDALMVDFVVQTGLAIIWTLLAMAMMMIADRSRNRALWIVGAALLALVVAKLVLVDLSNTGGWERIVAFIGVGVLMLAIGYFFPLPPRASGEPAKEEQA
jgi:uncharacterized membrane protein